MKYISNISMLTLAMIMASCSSEEIINTPQPEVANGGLIAQVESLQPDSRISFASEGQFFWSENDELAVSILPEKEGEVDNTFYRFGLSAGAGTQSGSFRGLSKEGTLKYAVYPYSKDSKLADSILTYVYPAEYEYSQVDEVIPTSGKTGFASIQAPLSGKIDAAQSKVTLSHLGGLVRIFAEKMPSTSGNFIFEANRNLTGEFTANLADKLPSLKISSGSTHVKDVTIHYTANKDQVGKVGIFYIPVPANEYKYFKLAFDADMDGEKDYVVTIDNPGDIKRGRIYEWHLQSFDFGGDEVNPAK